MLLVSLFIGCIVEELCISDILFNNTALLLKAAFTNTLCTTTLLQTSNLFYRYPIQKSIKICGVKSICKYFLFLLKIESRAYRYWYRISLVNWLLSKCLDIHSLFQIMINMYVIYIEKESVIRRCLEMYISLWIIIPLILDGCYPALVIRLSLINLFSQDHKFNTCILS